MKFLLGILLAFAPTLVAADCVWSDELPIQNEEILTFRECVAERKIRIGAIEVQANIDFQNGYPDCPECNTIWSIHSPDGKTAVVYVENSRYERNAWVIDRVTDEVRLFIDHSEGKHFIVEFDDNSRFRVIHAGMGYRTDYVYERADGIWSNTGHKKIDVEWP